MASTKSWRQSCRIMQRSVPDNRNATKQLAFTILTRPFLTRFRLRTSCAQYLKIFKTTLNRWTWGYTIERSSCNSWRFTKWQATTVQWLRIEQMGLEMTQVVTVVFKKNHRNSTRRIPMGHYGIGKCRTLSFWGWPHWQTTRINSLWGKGRSGPMPRSEEGIEIHYWNGPEDPDNPSVASHYISMQYCS